MSVRFGEMRKSSGLEVDHKPFPAMIVPFRSSITIKVFGADGLSWFDDRGLLDIKELPRDVVIMRDVATNGTAIPPVLIATQILGNPKFLRIIGKGLGDKAGTTMRVAKSRKSKAEGLLQAVVLKQRSLKLSIRPVQVRDVKKNWVYHCERNYDAKALLGRINAVWTPQANIVFALTSFNPARLEDEKALAEALGTKSENPLVPPIIEYNDFLGIFQKFRDNEKPKPDFTIFIVHRFTHGGLEGSGTTHLKGGFALVSDDVSDENDTTMAHEIGHYFGTLGKGSLYGDNNTSKDLLMSQGTDGTKIPFDDVIKYFNTNYK